MNIPPDVADALIREFDRKEEESPGNFINISAVYDVVRAADIQLPVTLSLPIVLSELIKRDWIESDGNGFDLTENSFRITAKGQIRSAASIDYADQYRRAVNALPSLNEAPVEIEPDGQVGVHHLTALNAATGPPEGQSATLSVFQNVTPTASTNPTFSEPRGSIGYARPAGPIFLAVDSSVWTGLPSGFVLTEQKQVKLVAMLQDAELALDSVGASNEEKAMARVYIVAAKVLADAPEPPTDLIWEMINRANQISGIAALLVSIIGLFV